MRTPKMKVYVLTFSAKDEDGIRNENMAGIFFSKDDAELSFNRLVGKRYDERVEFAKQGGGWWCVEDPIPGIDYADIHRYKVGERQKDCDRAVLIAVTQWAIKAQEDDKKKSSSFAGSYTGDWFTLTSTKPRRIEDS